MRVALEKTHFKQSWLRKADIHHLHGRTCIRCQLEIECWKALGTWVQALPDWSVKTLRGHASDQRDVKSIEQLEMGETGDLIWDALQHQLNVTGGNSLQRV